MSLINDEEAARRLARAIMSDVTLYNGERLAHAMDPERDLSSELGEARELFRTRVVPSHHAIFEDAVHAWAADARARATPDAPPPPPPEDKRVDPVLEDQDRRRAEVMESAKRTRTAMILALVLVAIAGATFAFVSHERQQETHDKHEGAHH